MLNMMSMMLTLLLVLRFGWLYAVPNAAATGMLENYGRCQTPNQESGLCVKISNCKILSNILKKKSSTSQENKYLSDSQCGEDNTRTGSILDRILVCCPDKDCDSSSGVDKRASGMEPANVLPNIGTCGTHFGDFIIGGTNTKIYEFPWMALLSYKKPGNIFGFHCGGSLINKRYVLTASHCLIGSELPKNWLLHSVRLGEWDTTTDPDCITEANGKKSCALPHVDVEIERRIPHELYMPNSVDQRHDIALLRLKDAITYTTYVTPICLPMSDVMLQNKFVGFAMDVAGWGKMENDNVSEIKKKVTLHVWELEKCKQKYTLFQKSVNDSQLCAGGDLKKDACGGDSGGPLMFASDVNNQRYFFIAAVTSYGPKPCGLQGWPGVYTRVGAYIDWIQDHMEP